MLRFAVVLMLAGACLGQITEPPTKPMRTIQDVDLALCRSDLAQWKDWYKTNQPIINATISNLHTVQDDNARLRERLQSIEETWLMGGAGLGAGVFLMFIFATAAKRVWTSVPAVAPVKKQLLVLILAASWITIAAFLAEQQPRLVNHPVNMAFTVAMYSLPALLFGGIAVWWFGKAKLTGRSTN